MDNHHNYNHHYQINKAIKYHTILMLIKIIKIITIIKSHRKQTKEVAIITMHLIPRHSNQTFSIQNHPTAIRTIIAGFLLHYIIPFKLIIFLLTLILFFLHP